MYPNYYSQTTPQSSYLRPQPIQQLGLKGRPVSSVEEVRASGIDFDGSIFYFPDIANKRIYTKQIGMDGTAILNMYELKEMPNPTDTSVFITRQEFNVALAQLTQIINGISAETPNTAVSAEPPSQPIYTNF